MRNDAAQILARRRAAAAASGGSILLYEADALGQNLSDVEDFEQLAMLPANLLRRDRADLSVAGAVANCLRPGGRRIIYDPSALVGYASTLVRSGPARVPLFFIG